MKKFMKLISVIMCVSIMPFAQVTLYAAEEEFAPDEDVIFISEDPEVTEEADPVYEVEEEPVFETDEVGDACSDEDGPKEERDESTLLNDASNEFRYVVNGDSITIMGYAGTPSGDLVIPDEIKGKKVTAIGDEAFYNCDGFTGSLIIPDSVETIGDNAF